MTAKTGTLTALGGAALGAGLMYVLDPDRGERRRQRLRRSLLRAGRQVSVFAQEAKRVIDKPSRLFA